MDGGKFQQLLGSRRQVFNGTAKKTNYGKNGLEKKDLKMNKHGLIVSAKKSKTAKKSKHLGKFLQKKGSKTFGPRKTAKKSKGGQYAGDHCEDEKTAVEEAEEALKKCKEDHENNDMIMTADEKEQEKIEEVGENMATEKTEKTDGGKKKKKSKKH